MSEENKDFSVYIPARDFLSALRGTYRFIKKISYSTLYNNRIFENVYVGNIYSNTVHAITTDGRRLAIYDFKIEHDRKFSCLIPKIIANKIIFLLKDMIKNWKGERELGEETEYVVDGYPVVKLIPSRSECFFEYGSVFWHIFLNSKSSGLKCVDYMKFVDSTDRNPSSKEGMLNFGLQADFYIEVMNSFRDAFACEMNSKKTILPVIIEPTDNKTPYMFTCKQVPKLTIYVAPCHV